MAVEAEASELSPFGAKDEIAVQRGLAEFRGGRPIEIENAAKERLIALPLDGMTLAILKTFRSLCGSGAVEVAVTARRARALGLDAQKSILIQTYPADTIEDLWALATKAEAGVRLRQHRPAGAAVDAAVELAKLAQRLPALLVCQGCSASELASMELIRMQADAVARFRGSLIDSVALAGKAQVPLRDGIPACFHVFRDAAGASPTAIVIGEPDFSLPVPVRLHSSCLTGDVFGSRRCDCGAQLQLAITRLAEAGGGIILYLEQEGRGLGLANKMRAYALQDAGLDTVDANTTLGFDDDERDYGIAARMLQLMGCRQVLLMTNNPGKLDGLNQAGIEIAGRVPLYTPINSDNRRYLAAKAARAGHWLDAALNHGQDGSDAAEPERGA